jgi:ArsR family transcriptional regulator
MTEILQIGQSTLSSQLGQLKDHELVSYRREGQFVFYRIPRHSQDTLVGKLMWAVRDLVPEADWYERDQRTLKEIMERRREASLAFFNGMASQNQRSPGQGWESLAKGLLSIIRGLRVVDLGCGNGRLSALLAQGGNNVIGVDNSGEQIRLAQELHQKQKNETTRTGSSLEFVRAEMEHTGLPKASFDLVVISQALHHIPRPQDALLEAARILRPNGQLLILDLANHNEDWIQDKFGDFWLGFEEDNLQEWLHEAGFFEITIEIAGRDLEYPSIESLVVSALRISAPHGHG